MGAHALIEDLTAAGCINPARPTEAARIECELAPPSSPPLTLLLDGVRRVLGERSKDDGAARIGGYQGPHAVSQGEGRGVKTGAVKTGAVKTAMREAGSRCLAIKTVHRDTPPPPPSTIGRTHARHAQEHRQRNQEETRCQAFSVPAYSIGAKKMPRRRWKMGVMHFLRGKENARASSIFFAPIENAANVSQRMVRRSPGYPKFIHLAYTGASTWRTLGPVPGVHWGQPRVGRATPCPVCMRTTALPAIAGARLEGFAAVRGCPSRCTTPHCAPCTVCIQTRDAAVAMPEDGQDAIWSFGETPKGLPTMIALGAMYIVPRGRLTPSPPTPPAQQGTAAVGRRRCRWSRN